jgi:hypothetical protein
LQHAAVLLAFVGAATALWQMICSVLAFCAVQCIDLLQKLVCGACPSTGVAVRSRHGRRCSERSPPDGCSSGLQTHDSVTDPSPEPWVT